MVMGRPRIWDREDLFEKLLLWARLPNSLHLSAFCALYDPPLYLKKLIEFSHENEDFRESYEIAKTFLCARREEANSEWPKRLSDKAFSCNHLAYDYHAYTHWQEQKKFESSLRIDEDGNKPTQITVKVTHDGLGAGLNVSAEGVPTPFNKSA